jgi:hypothetical protein
VYLDAWQGQISISTDLGDRETVQEWMENKKYSPEDLLIVARNNKWTIDKKTEIHTIVSDSKNPHGPLEYKQIDGRSSD